MRNRTMTFGLIGLILASAATPALAQGISIGPDGVRILDNRDQVERRRDQVERRAAPIERRDRRARVDVSEREAIRIARGEGVREVEDVRRTRRAFRVVGLDRRGDDIRVDVDRLSGEVLSVR